MLGLIGPNGAGKSTLVNLLSGFDLPSAGTIVLNGRVITTWSAHRRGRSGLARTFQHSHAFRSLSVRENIEVAALGVGQSPRRARQTADELLGDEPTPSAATSTFSRTDSWRKACECWNVRASP